MTPPHLLRSFVLPSLVKVAHRVVSTHLFLHTLSSDSNPPCRKAMPVPTPSLTLPACKGATLTESLALSPCTEFRPVNSPPQVNGGISILHTHSTLSAPERQQPIDSNKWPLQNFTLIFVPKADPILYPKLGPMPPRSLHAIKGEPFIGAILPGCISVTAAHELTFFRPFVNLHFNCSPRPLTRRKCSTNPLWATPYVVEIEGNMFYPRPCLNPEDVLACKPIASMQWLLHAQPICFRNDIRRGLLQQELAFL